VANGVANKNRITEPPVDANDIAALERVPDGQPSALIVDAALVAAAHDAVAEGNEETVRALIAPLHAADLADLIQELERADRRAVVPMISRDLLPDVLAEFGETVRDEVIEALGPQETAAVVADMDIDDTLHVNADLDEDDQQRLLDAIPEPDRLLIEEGLSHPEFSPGVQRRATHAAPSRRAARVLDGRGYHR
jgi:magnesium transporter